ncbi:hypothetical protein EMIT0324P_250005 [Pseudomonas chlororaphis]
MGTAYVFHDAAANKDVLDKASEGLMNYLSITSDGANAPAFKVGIKLAASIH